LALHQPATSFLRQFGAIPFAHINAMTAFEHPCALKKDKT
jgi:hypothetical protein